MFDRLRRYADRKAGEARSYNPDCEEHAEGITRMAEHFNGLTPAQAERFAILAEEANEVAQMCMKILRHGRDSYHPDDASKTPNHALLTRETADFLAVMNDIVWYGDMAEPSEQQIAHSRAKKKRFTHHQNVTY